MKIGGRQQWNVGTFGLAALVCLTAAGAGCSSSAPVASSTPPITVNSRATAASALLLMTQADMQAIDGLSGVTATEIKDVPLDQNPDQRGPCGAVVPQAPTTGATGRDFKATSAEVIELINADGNGQEAFLSALQADHHEGCGTYTGTTKTGATQVVTHIAFVDLKSLGVPSIAWTSVVAANKIAVFAGVFVLDVKGHQLFVQIESSVQITDAMMKALATAALHRANG